MTSTCAHVCPFRMRIRPPVPSAARAPSVLSEVTMMISAAVPELFGRSATSAVVSTCLCLRNGSFAGGAFHSHCRSGAKTPGLIDVLHVVLTGRVPPLTHTASLLPSMRQPAPQQYVSFWHMSMAGLHGPPLTLHTPPVIPIGAFTQTWFMGHGLLGGSHGV